MRLKQIRRMKGISQKQLADSLGVSQPTVCDWQSGKKAPTTGSLMLIAEYFGMSVDELVSDERAKEKPTHERELDSVLVESLLMLSSEQQQRVLDFVAGMRASNRA